MTWTTPRTWTIGELVTKTMLDTHLRDNLLALKDPPGDQIVRDNGGAYTTTSTTPVAVDSTNLKITLTTNGGDVLVWFMGTFSQSTAATIYLDIQVDGATRVGGGFNGLLSQYVSTTRTVITIPPVVVSGLAAGEHTFELLWRTSTGTLSLHADTTSGTATNNVPALLVTREVS